MQLDCNLGSLWGTHVDFLRFAAHGKLSSCFIKDLQKVTNVLQISTIRIDNNFVSINNSIVEFTAQFALLAPKARLRPSSYRAELSVSLTMPLVGL